MTEEDDDPHSVAFPLDESANKAGSDSESSGDDEEAEPTTCRARVAKRKGLVLTLFLVSVGIGVANILFDWLWVSDMVSAQRALVFGPPSTAMLALLCLAASVGTLAFIAEISNQIYKHVRKVELFPEPIEQLASLFLDEVPMATLNMLLASCREVPVSYFYLFKAAVSMVSAGVRCLKVLCYMCGCKKPKRVKSARFVCLRRVSYWIILVASAYILTASILTWIYTFNTPPHDVTGPRGFKIPEHIAGKHYDSARYFPRSGVFLAPTPEASCQRHSSGSDTDTDWIRIAKIYAYVGLKEEQLIRAVYAYSNDTAITWVGSPFRQYCYTTSLATCHTTEMENGTICDWGGLPSAISLQFIYSPRTKTIVFGDILVSAAIRYDGSCQVLRVDQWGHLTSKSGTSFGQLQYFQGKSSVNITRPFKEVGEGEAAGGGDGTGEVQYEFYDQNADLNNVTEVWKTGYHYCDMTGSLTPNPTTSIPPTCLTEPTT